MTLQASGAISFSDLRTEYVGGSAAISLGSYYRGGSAVRGNAANNPSTNLSASVPTSGNAISLNDFYGQEKGFQYTEGTNRSNKNAQDYFGTDYTVNYPKKIIVNSTITNTNVDGKALSFPSGLSGTMNLTVNGAITSTTGHCLENLSGVTVTVDGSGTLTRNSADVFVSALQGNGSVQINYIGGFGGASGGNIRHSDYGGNFNSKLTRSGNTFTLSWTYNECDYSNVGAGSRDVSDMFPLDGNGNYDYTNTSDITNSANVASAGRDTRNVAVGRELRSGTMYYWFCSNNKSTSLELSNDRYIQYGHTQTSLTTSNSQRSSVIQSSSASTSTGSFSISGPTIN